MNRTLYPSFNFNSPLFCSYFLWDRLYTGLGNRSFALLLFTLLLFCSFQKERQGAIRSFALFKKSEKERFAPLLFSKIAQKSDSLFRSFKKSKKEQIALLLFWKRATKSKWLFRSLQKERKECKKSKS